MKERSWRYREMRLEQIEVADIFAQLSPNVSSVFLCTFLIPLSHFSLTSQIYTASLTSHVSSLASTHRSHLALTTERGESKVRAR